ncbi:hypothetical protein ACVWZD_001344 [Streptomyces sp. TE3672]
MLHALDLGSSQDGYRIEAPVRGVGDLVEVAADLV